MKIEEIAVEVPSDVLVIVEPSELTTLVVCVKTRLDVESTVDVIELNSVFVWLRVIKLPFWVACRIVVDTSEARMVEFEVITRLVE